MGLNITEDEYVLLKLKENKAKKGRKKKLSSSKSNKIDKISAASDTTNTIISIAFSAGMPNKENRMSNKICYSILTKSYQFN